jgi:hypothetical protein
MSGLHKGETILRLYHGNPDPDFKPYHGGGMSYHDYGKGLYCTEDSESAKEWACQRADIGVSYVYVYEVDTAGLEPVLDLNEYAPAYWLSALAQYRFDAKESFARRERRERFINLFAINCEHYEVIRGWRADDRYFAFLSAFLGMDISYEAIVQAIKLGGLGQQVVIKGKTAYGRFKQMDKLIVSGVEYTKYQAQYIERDRLARDDLRQVRDIPGQMLDRVLENGGLAE